MYFARCPSASRFVRQRRRVTSVRTSWFNFLSDRSSPREEVWEVAQRVESHGPVQVDEYTILIAALGRSHSWQRSLDTLDRARAMHHDVRPFNAALKACKLSSRWDLSVHLLSEIRQSCLSPDAVSYSMAISACGEATVPSTQPGRRRPEPRPQWELALRLFEEADGPTLRDNNYPLHCAMAVCGKGGAWQRALWLFATECTAPQVSAVGYGTAIGACAQAFEWHMAVHLFDKSLSHGFDPHLKSYYGVIAAFVSSTLWAQALSVFEDMLLAKLQPDRKCFTNAIIACEQGRCWKHAVALLEQMEHQCLWPDNFQFRTALKAYTGKPQQKAVSRGDKGSL